MTPGGKGVNVARVARELGAGAVLVGFVPGRTGARGGGAAGRRGARRGAASRSAASCARPRSSWSAAGRVTVFNEPGPSLGAGRLGALRGDRGRRAAPGRRAGLQRLAAAGGADDAYARLVKARRRARRAGGRGRRGRSTRRRAGAAGADVVTPNLAEAEGLLHGRADETVEAGDPRRARARDGGRAGPGRARRGASGGHGGRGGRGGRRRLDGAWVGGPGRIRGAQPDRRGRRLRRGPGARAGARRGVRRRRWARAWRAARRAWRPRWRASSCRRGWRRCSPPRALSGAASTTVVDGCCPATAIDRVNAAAARPGAAGDSFPSVMLFASRSAAGAHTAATPTPLTSLSFRLGCRATSHDNVVRRVDVSGSRERGERGEAHDARRGEQRGRQPEDGLARRQRRERRAAGDGCARRGGHSEPGLRAQRRRPLAAPRERQRAGARDRGPRQPVLLGHRAYGRGRRSPAQPHPHHRLVRGGRRARARVRPTPAAPIGRRAADRPRRRRPPLPAARDGRGHPDRLPRPPAARRRGRHRPARQPRRRPRRGRAPRAPRP